MKKFPFFFQLEAKDCGPTCIQMITTYFGRKIPLSQIKDICNVSRLGVSTLDIVRCFKQIGFKSVTVPISMEELERMPLPAILYWRQEHYVVIYAIEKKRSEAYYCIADPSYGRIKLSEEKFTQSWLNDNTGIAILMKPLDDFYTYPLEYENKEGVAKKTARLFYNIYKEHKRGIKFSLILVLASIVLNWTMPVILQKIIDNGVLANDLPMVWKLMLLQLSFFCGYTISDAFSSIILTKINFTESVKYLVEYLNKLVRLPIKFFDIRLNTDLIQRMEDQERVQSFLTYKFLDLFFAILNLIVFSSILLYFSGSAFIVFLILSAFSIGWTILFLKKRKRLDYDRFFVVSQNQNNIYEMIFGMPEIKINDAHEVRISKWERMQKGMNKITLQSLYLNFYQLIGSSFVTRLRDIIITGLCAYFVISGQMTLGVMMTISYILGQLSSPISQLTQFAQTFQDASNSLERLEDIQRRENEDDSEKIDIHSIKEGYFFDHISFKYIENATSFVIKDLSLQIPEGKITAIVGVSGSGKTTLVKLLLSFYYPQQGNVLLDGVPLFQINSSSLRKMCGVVMQDGYIFSSTIAENIALFEDTPNMELVKQAAKLACINSFIEELPMKYETKIGRAGIELSGGQKQRILIARAVYKNPQIIILDEATSSLDANNEKEILDNLNLFFKGKTVVVIAHRLSTVKNADKIVVIDKGRIVEEGTHRNLSAANGMYYNLVKNQLELGA